MTDYQVFISYRRDGGEHLAGRISDRLRELGYNVFYDVESMRSGTFNTQLLEAIDVSEDFLLILPPNGLDRCKDEDDWVRKEIIHAIKCNKNIIPVMMRNFEFPENMPAEIEKIKIYEGVRAASDYFDAVINRIDALLKSTPIAQKNSPSIDNAIKLIRAGLYPQAGDYLDKLIQADPINAEAYFYLAICLLKGKRPFMAVKSEIDKIEGLLNSAVGLNARAIYYYFLAYIKYDFHQQKCLKTSPDYRQTYQTALEMGITNREINDLYLLLKVQRPTCL